MCRLGRKRGIHISRIRVKLDEHSVYRRRGRKNQTKKIQFEGQKEKWGILMNRKDGDKGE